MSTRVIKTTDYEGPDRRNHASVWPRLLPLWITVLVLTISATSFMIRAHSYTVHEQDFALFYPIAAGKALETRLNGIDETLKEMKGDLKEIKRWLGERPRTYGPAV